jgi:predicted DNA-binding protein with PD1-like motif
VIGGHLKPGTIVNTTAEVVILDFEKLVFTRVLDKSTGYRELIVEDNN